MDENTLELAIDSFIKNVMEKIFFPQVNEKWITKYNYKNGSRKLVKDGGAKFLRLSTIDLNEDGSETKHGKSSWCFIALCDGENKKLGKWKTGQIFKCDGYKSPAKHARGSVFDTGEDGCCGISQYTGPDYLKM